jgi:HK97 family phage portal protein
MGLLARYLSAGYPSLSSSDPRAWTPGSVIHMDALSGSTEAALKVSVVWRAINVLSAAVAMLPINIYRQLEDGKGREVDKSNPWRAPLRLRPNRLQTSFRWRMHLVGQVLLAGNYYAEIRRERQLWPLDASRMRVLEVRPDGGLRYEYTQRTGRAVPLEQEQLLHIRGFSRDGIVGVGVLDLMRDAVAQKTMAQRARTAAFRNGLRPSVVIKHPGELGDSGRDNLVAGFKRAYGGPDKAGETMVLDEGMTIEEFSLSARDAQFIEGEHFLVEEFLRFCGGVPGVLVGYADKTATYASAEAFFQAFATHVVAPLTKNIEQELTTALFPDEAGDVTVEMSLEGLLRGDSAARATFYRTMIELGIYTRNEVRAMENRNPLPGLDEPLTPLNMDRGSRPEPAPPAPRRPAAPPPDDSREDDDEDAASRETRLRALARSAAASVVRREVLAIAGDARRKGAAQRFAADPAGWQAWLARFYREEHPPRVASALLVDAAAAARYCEAQLAAVLQGGVAAVTAWEETRVPLLERLALGEESAC